MIETHGRQLKVKEGDVVQLDNIPGQIGSKVVFDRLLFAHTGSEYLAPSELAGKAKVTATVVRQARSPKILAFRYKPKKRVRRRYGHRQPSTELRIEEIVLP